MVTSLWKVVAPDVAGIARREAVGVVEEAVVLLTSPPSPLLDAIWRILLLIFS